MLKEQKTGIVSPPSGSNDPLRRLRTEDLIGMARGSFGVKMPLKSNVFKIIFGFKKLAQ